jgi:hypothetical protein
MDMENRLLYSIDHVTRPGWAGPGWGRAGLGWAGAGLGWPTPLPTESSGGAFAQKNLDALDEPLLPGRLRGAAGTPARSRER